MLIARHGGRQLPGGIDLIVGCVAALALSALLTGCTGAASDSPLPSSSPPGTTTTPVTTSRTSAPTTSTPSPTLTRPVLPEAAKQRTAAGAEAFYRYTWEVYNYAFAARDADAITSLAQTGCTFCDGAAKSIATAVSGGYQFEGGVTSVRLASASPEGVEAQVIVNGLVDQTPGKTVNASGQQVAATEAASGRRADALFKWLDGRWHIVEIQVAKK